MAGPSGFHWPKETSSYSKVKEMCWIDMKITSLLELNLYSELVSLNLHCNQISRIEGLDTLFNLKHLDLSSNQISKIQGLENLHSLRTLNLSCNQITMVEGLESLKHLRKFDTSYNFVKNISGFKDLHGSSYSISHVYLHGNQLASLEHVIHSLIGCVNLKDLTLELYGDNNPVCDLKEYRSSLLSAMRSLEVLDGLDRDGKPATAVHRESDNPGTSTRLTP